MSVQNPVKKGLSDVRWSGNVLQSNNPLERAVEFSIHMAVDQGVATTLEYDQETRMFQVIVHADESAPSGVRFGYVEGRPFVDRTLIQEVHYNGKTNLFEHAIDASEMRLAPGEWPQEILTNFNSGHPFVRNIGFSTKDYTYYVQRGSAHALVVYHD